MNSRGIATGAIAFVLLAIAALYAQITKPPLAATLPCPLWTDPRCVSVVGGGGSGGGLLVVHTGAAAALGCGFVNVEVLP